MNERTEAHCMAAAREIAHVPMLETLTDKVRPRHSALVVIDVQNDFCAENGFVARGGRDVSQVPGMVSRLRKLITHARRAGVLLVFVRCSYSAEGNRYLSDVWLEQAARRQGGGYTLAPVCQDGTWGVQFYGGVSPNSDDIVIVKHRYSAFQGTELDLMLRSRGVRTVVLTGVSTHVCVETTAREAFVRDYYTVVVGDCCAAYTQAEHETSLTLIDRFFGEVTRMEDLCLLWTLHSNNR
jgi:ureidoacrylate peracid hydrolase